MIAFPGMLVGPAVSAGMKVPDDADKWDTDENREKFVHFFVFCILQLGRSMPRPDSHWENAKLIAEIPEFRLKNMTLDDILLMGYE